MEFNETTGLKEPRDRFWFVYLVFYYIGLTIMFPYSMLITITDFWYYKFRNTSIPFNTTTDQLTEMQINFPAYLSVTGNVPLTVLVVLTVVLGYRINIRLRLLISACLMVVTFAIITLFSGLNTDDWQDGLFLAVLLVNTIYSSVNAIFQASFLGNLGRFPPRYIGSANDGMGFGSALPAIINIIIIAVGSNQENIGVICMSFSVLVILVMIALYIPASNTDFYTHHAGLQDLHQGTAGISDYLEVLKKTWIYVLVIFVNYGQTLALYPAVAALVKPVSQDSSRWNEVYFLPVCCFLFQALGDWIGRSIATFTQWPGPGKYSEIGMLVSVLLRGGVIPLVMRCNIAPLNRSTDILFKSDLAFIIIFGIFNISGGFIGNVSLMLGPKKVGLDLQEVSGTIFIAILVFGLGLGSLLGPSLVSLL
ncbi:equilibrative nucleoside transporter 3 [Eurytemora carolleeae]|uniref:equilibrative nucleoside transporter 3 n=1 Tax=Eurytemora carolleeae TaxID=1294199 RepID=UPI000C787F80|nr:equilibrative nucleoside transporter 3 [Eurytemora carolleeae]|eukprot:XP_023335360.1 equilibrative nucleoside transporter 3-like [Eurytemora affinis]